MADTARREKELLIEAIALAEQKKKKEEQKKKKAEQDTRNQLALLLLPNPNPPGAKNTRQSRLDTQNAIKSAKAKIERYQPTAMDGRKKPSQMERLDAELSRISVGEDASPLLRQQRLERHDNSTRENYKWFNDVVVPRLKDVANPLQVWKSDPYGHLVKPKWALLDETEMVLKLSDSETMDSPRPYLVSQIKYTDKTHTRCLIQVVFSRLPKENESWVTRVKRMCFNTYQQRNNFILSVPLRPQDVPFHRQRDL